MITSLRLINFKNFADETLRLGPFTLMVGANASGKSNIRDALRFLHGVGRGYTLPEIVGGRYGAGGQPEWEPIRGAPNEIVRMKRPGPPRTGDFSLKLELGLEGRDTSYSITIRFNPNRPDGLRVLKEELRADSKLSYATEAESYRRIQHPVQMGDGQAQVPIRFNRVQPALTQFRRQRVLRSIIHNFDSEALAALESALALERALDRMRFLELSPEHLREPSSPGASVLGDSGQNLPTVLEDICGSPEREKVLASWIHELTPIEVDSFEFPRDPNGLVHLRIVERNGKSISAYSASDGTLRFLGILAALLGNNPAGVYFFEEIENGIHPNRLWLLLELMEKQTEKNGIQVIATTHSPDILDLISDRTFENTSVVSRLEDSDDAIIRPLVDLPNAKKLRHSQRLGRLHSGGWMEDMVNLAAWRERDNEDGG